MNKSAWYYSVVQTAYKEGWVLGYKEGLEYTFKPNQQINRAEAVVMLNRALNRVPDQAFIDGNKQELKTFSDLEEAPKRHWAYYDIMEAANTFVSAG